MRRRCRKSQRRLFYEQPPDAEPDCLRTMHINDLPEPILLEVRVCVVVRVQPLTNATFWRRHKRTDARRSVSAALRYGCCATRRAAHRRRCSALRCADKQLAALASLLQIFRHLGTLPPVATPEEAALYTRKLPFKTFEHPGECHPGHRSYPFLAQVCRHWKAVLECPAALQLWRELVVDFGHELVTGESCLAPARHPVQQAHRVAIVRDAAPRCCVASPDSRCRRRFQACMCLWLGATCGRRTPSSGRPLPP